MNLKEIRKNIKTQKERITFYQSEILRLYKNVDSGKIKGEENIQKLFDHIHLICDTLLSCYTRQKIHNQY